MSEEEETLDTRVRSYSKSDSNSKMASNKKKIEVEMEIQSDKDKEDFLSKELKKPSSEKDWWERFKAIHGTLAGVQQELSEVAKIKGKVETFSTEWKEQVDIKVQVLDLCDSDKDYQLKLLANIVIRQDEKIRELEGKVNAMMGKELRPNLVIDGIVEEKEDPQQKLWDKVTAFFKEQMQIQEEVKIQDVF